MAKKQTAAADRLGVEDDPVFGYRALPGIADEMLDAQGNVRPVWQRLLSTLGRLDETDLANRFARADRYLRDAGVFYRVYGGKDSSERSWPLSHIPVLIDENEWATVSQGLIQRAELLEKVVADIYGENRLVREGLLPPALVASNPDFLRPLVGVKPADGHFLQFISFEIGRGPDGNWWVLSDRTEAPSGAGFALENRVATTGPSPISTPKPMCIGLPASSAPSATRCRRASCIRTIASPCFRRGSPTRPISSMPISPAISASCSWKAKT